MHVGCKKWVWFRTQACLTLNPEVFPKRQLHGQAATSASHCCLPNIYSSFWTGPSQPHPNAFHSCWGSVLTQLDSLSCCSQSIMTSRCPQTVKADANLPLKASSLDLSSSGFPVASPTQPDQKAVRPQGPSLPAPTAQSQAPYGCCCC